MRVFLFVFIPLMLLIGFLQTLKTQATICFSSSYEVIYVSKGDLYAPNHIDGCVCDEVTYKELESLRIKLNNLYH